MLRDNCSAEMANSSTATKFYNTKMNVANETQRVLTLLLMGMTFSDLYSCVKHNSIEGLPPDVNIRMLNSFAHKYGRTPDLVRLAVPTDNVSRFGLMTTEKVVRKGQRVERKLMYFSLITTLQWAEKRKSCRLMAGRLVVLVLLMCALDL